MNEYGRILNPLIHVREDLHHFAPVPLIYRDVGFPDIDEVNRKLIELARVTYSRPVLEVPDRRHATDLGQPPETADLTWSEQQATPVGIWHRVPTNSFLEIDNDLVKRLREVIEERYRFALAATGQAEPASVVTPWISESWIQFYQDGDDKVLHNHERYGPPYPNRRWSGAYYLDDGSPDESMPYAGVFSFRVRDTNYFIRPRAGLLMLWPADILHEVLPFYGSGERIVINFNINTVEAPH